MSRGRNRCEESVILGTEWRAVCSYLRGRIGGLRREKTRNPGTARNHCKLLKIERLREVEVSQELPSFRQASGQPKMGNSLLSLSHGC
jgi:hypothetical protein